MRATFHKYQKKIRGATLLELLVYVAVLAGLTVVIAQAFLSVGGARKQSEARSEVNASIRFVSERIRQDIKSAEILTTPLLGTLSDTLVMTIAGVTVTYDVVSGVLRRNGEAITGGDILVGVPSFTRLENQNPNVGTSLLATTTSVKIVIPFRYNVSGTHWMYENTLQTTVALR